MTPEEAKSYFKTVTPNTIQYQLFLEAIAALSIFDFTVNDGWDIVQHTTRRHYLLETCNWRKGIAVSFQPENQAEKWDKNNAAAWYLIDQINKDKILE